MDFLKPENIAAASGLLVPGLIAMLVYDQLVPNERRDWSKHTLEAVAFGAGNYLLLSPAFKWLARHEFGLSWGGVGWLLGTIFLHFVAPIAWAFGIFWARKRLAARGWIALHPTPTAWDYVFGTLRSGWLRVRLRDGTRVGGRWESGAFAGTSVTKRDLYLKSARPIGEDGTFGDDHLTPQDLLIREEEIGLIEILPDPIQTEDTNGKQASHAAALGSDNTTAVESDRGRVSTAAGEEGLLSVWSDHQSSASSPNGADGPASPKKVGTQ